MKKLMDTKNTSKNAPVQRCEKYAKLAVYSLVLLLVVFACLAVTVSMGLLVNANGIIAFLAIVCLCLPVVALVFSIMAMINGRKGGLSPKGRRLANLGCFGSGLIFLFLLAAILLPLLSKAAPINDFLRCQNELKQAQLALVLYSDCHHGTFPEETEWETVVNQEFPQEYRQQAIATLESLCPGHHYIYWKPDDSPKPPQYNPPLLADAESYHKGKHNVIYLNGHVDSLTPEEFKLLCATPSNPRVPQKIVYVETGAFGPTEKFTIDLEAEKITWEISYTVGDIGNGSDYQKREVPLEEVKKIRASLAEFPAGKWDENYPNPPGALDGTQWRLEIVYSNGTSRNITGSNVWPRDFPRHLFDDIKRKSQKSIE